MSSVANAELSKSASCDQSGYAVRELYDSWAADYDRDGVGSPYYAYLESRYRQLILDSLPFMKRNVVLELGCGSGNHTAILASGASYAIGVDLSKGLLTVAKRKLAGLHTSGLVDLIAADVRHLPVKDGSVHAAISLGQVFGHFPSPQRGAVEAARVLSSGGLFMLEYDNKWSVDFLHYVVDALTRGKLLHLGFSSFSTLRSYVTTGTYTWNINNKAFNISSSIPFHKVSLRHLMGQLRNARLNVCHMCGLHVLTLFFPASMQEATSSKVINWYVHAMSKVDRTISGTSPFNWLGGSVVLQGFKL